MAFKDRKDAGQQLARMLAPYEKERCLVLALPRGGVVVGHEIAQQLHQPLDVLIVRKIGAPRHEELAAGAIAPGNVLILNRDVLAVLGLQPDALAAKIEQEKQELERRLKLYRGDRPFPDVSGLTIILVDDGMATGATAKAAVRAVKEMHPAKLVLAVPVGARPTISELRYEVDELVCLEAPEHFEAVSNWYVNFPQNTDQEVISLLQENWQEQNPFAIRP